MAKPLLKGRIGKAKGQETSKGVLIYAHNNEHINYLQLAFANALLIKKHLKVPVSLITDNWSLLWDYYVDNEDKFKSVFDKIIVLEKEDVKNTRDYRDTIYYSIPCSFNNTTRNSAYELSPYDETLLIDADYLILDDVLNNVWGSIEEVMINKKAIKLDGSSLTGPEFRLSDFGVRMYWATVVYFKKCEKAKLLFDMVSHIKQHWDFYKLIYEFGGGLYRNDFAFSVAIHTLNGFYEGDEFKSLPCPSILTVLDSDQLYEYLGNEQFLFFFNNPTENWKFSLTKVKGTSVHVLNKLSLIREIDKLIEELYV